ncbi:MAG: hypothetical protein LPK26_21095 [Bacillaceae bacterium]|nr:hypothetical protein [Bacillaceae bacterium]
MFNKNKERSLTEYEISKIQDFITNAVNQMLNSGEVVFDAMNEYDLLLSVSARDEYIQGCIYQYSRCEIENGSIVELHDPPLFAGQRHYLNIEDFDHFLDENALEYLDADSVQACILMSGLIRSFKLQNNNYENGENAARIHHDDLTESEEQQIVDVLKRCLLDTQKYQHTKHERINAVDTMLQTTFEDGVISVYLYKASECGISMNSPFEMSFEFPDPIYWADLDPRQGFSSGANSEIRGTKYLAVCQFVNDCLANTVRR